MGRRHRLLADLPRRSGRRRRLRRVCRDTDRDRHRRDSRDRGRYFSRLDPVADRSRARRPSCSDVAGLQDHLRRVYEQIKINGYPMIWR